MTRQRSKKLSESRKAENISRNATTLDSDQESAHSESESENPSIASKDDEEEELDRLVLGDGAGFKAQLAYDFNAGRNESDGEVAEEDEEAEEGLENVDDADLFFLDAGPSTIDPTALATRASSDEYDDGDAPAWEDSDDDRLTISLAGNPRLRKLRKSEADDVVSGKEYTRRLRRQFERMNPVPEWAKEAARPAKRRRRYLYPSLGATTSECWFVDQDADEYE
ncbi:putative U3 small nucleolar RNA-associated protein 18 [Glarea lozoyensis 74030]|uniref:Putative U3 small nucleolar RNA-associated protein 18 n=1 Tax=Glarea lozoyensis (strain ATCC 74030 / MF5533) TaxID=1104152 RepID=H0EFP4_GLAL7|nr:putative U3 small nucleolar RNA-associated protein 18 [Glarea lozoyensis 74030]